KGQSNSFEVLRQLPSELGKTATGNEGDEKKTIMLSLFQPAESGQRIFQLLTSVLNELYANNRPPHKKQPRLGCLIIRNTIKTYNLARPMAIATAVFIFLLWLVHLLLNHSEEGTNPLRSDFSHWMNFQSGFLVCGFILCYLLLALIWLAQTVKSEIIHGIIKNDLGLCRGSSQVTVDGAPVPALIEWIHEAIQRGAGLSLDGPPLTFEDLWNAPLWPGGHSPELDENDVPLERSINLEMVTTNVTHGRPYRLPLVDREARLFFDPEEWKKFFPEQVMTSLCKASSPYRPLSAKDPSKPRGHERLFELPCGKLPIVVAARLSLSFPLLFSTVPLYAIDHEDKSGEKYKLRLCRFSDGGLCSNFPVHFFDSALPRWPTFALSLEERNYFVEDDEPVSLPKSQDSGAHERWYRFEPEEAVNNQENSVRISSKKQARKFSTLTRFLWSAYLTSKDWRDKTAIRMPHVRRRVVRLALEPKNGEGQMNIGMTEETIMSMAKTYGTASGKLLCDEYATRDSKPGDAWREHVWVRSQVILQALNRLLRNFSIATTSEGYTLGTRQLLQEAADKPPINHQLDKRQLSESQQAELNELVERVAELESALSSRSDIPHKPEPLPELRLRPPL
ncbi:MAG: hypothetical protein AB8B87_24890, partial [Granulosicoccus sp.]